MRIGKATAGALALAVAALTLALVFGGREDSNGARAQDPAAEGRPSVEIIAPRNGARQRDRAAVVKVEVENFRLAPGLFGAAPQLGEGHVRYSLNRVPDCVDPAKLEFAENSPIGRGRLVGASFDYPEYAGPNGVLAERAGTAGSYSPGTRTSIYYRNLRAGFYRVVVNLAQNNGATTPYNDVTHFEILAPPGHGPKPCPPGKVPSAAAAGGMR